MALAEPRPGSQPPVDQHCDQPDVGMGWVDGVGSALPNPVDHVGASIFPKGMGLWPGEGRAGAGLPTTSREAAWSPGHLRSAAWLPWEEAGRCSAATRSGPPAPHDGAGVTGSTPSLGSLSGSLGKLSADLSRACHWPR